MESLILAVSLMCALGAPAPARAAEEAKAAETKGDYVRKAHAAVDALSVKIDALELKAKDAGSSAREGMDEKLTALKARRKTLKKDLARLKRASGKAWANIKAGLDKGLEDLKKDLEEADKD